VPLVHDDALEVHDGSDDPIVRQVRRCHRDGGGVMTTIETDGVTLGV
jgi:hypothetical protein